MDERLLNDLKESYGLMARSFSRVNGGYKNELWRVETESKTLLVKVFSPERFSPGKIENINTALLRQQAVHDAGVPCPQVYLADGRAVRSTEEYSYMVMDYCKGHNLAPKSIAIEQMLSLGEAIAKTHRALADLPSDAAQGYARNPEKLLAAIHALAEKREDIKTIARTWSIEKLMAVPSGFAHEDMTADNVLFDEKGVAAIIDFDRCCYGYPLHDVGRAILSFALIDEGLDKEKVRAFVQGYRRILPLENIAQALELTWLIEAPWWLHKENEQITGKAKRFREEILYLTKHYDALPDCLKMD